jgi:hypothetical protein
MKKIQKKHRMKVLFVDFQVRWLRLSLSTKWRMIWFTFGNGCVVITVDICWKRRCTSSSVVFHLFWLLIISFALLTWISVNVWFHNLWTSFFEVLSICSRTNEFSVVYLLFRSMVVAILEAIWCLVTVGLFNK